MKLERWEAVLYGAAILLATVASAFWPGVWGA